MSAWFGPHTALLVLLVAIVFYMRLAFMRTKLHKRPILLIAALLALALPAYVALEWVGWISARYLRLARPLLSVPCALIVLAVLHRLLRLSERQHRYRRLLTELFVALSVVSAALATIGVEVGRPLDRMAVIVAIDKSRSIELVPEVESRVRAELEVAQQSMRDDDRIGTIAFGADAAIEEPLRPKTQFLPRQNAEVARDGTDLGAAIRRALAEVPADTTARIVLLSDGVSTRGDALSAAAAAVAAGVPVDAVPLDQTKAPDVRVLGVRMNSRASEGEPLEISIVTAAPKAAKVELRLYRDGELIRKGEATLAAGEDVVRLRELAPEPGLHRYDVELSTMDPALDDNPEDNVGSSFVRVRGQASALVMERDPSLAGALVSALESGAFRVQLVGPLGTPADVSELAAYDVVVLSDISAAELAPSQIEAIATYVRHLGGGLLLLGGDRSFGPGGYGKTPIEEVSPVDFDIKQDRRRASLAEVIAVDYSGSMQMRVAGQTKLELANAGAIRSMQLLSAGDRLGVLHVDTEVEWTIPLMPVKDKAALIEKIRAVGPGGGGILIDLTLTAAYEALSKQHVNLKHLLLFADGDDAEERNHAFALVGAAKRRGITTSVVALGRGSDVPALERMSQLGGGRFYLIEDATRLPAVFAQETILASKSAINEVAFKALLTNPSPATRGIDFTQAPELTGYVVTIPKPRAEVHLQAAEGDPLLASWSVGIGRSAAFTSDYKDRWGEAWTGWTGASRLFAQVLRDIARRSDDPRVRLEASTRGGELELRATVVDDDGRTESFRRLKAIVAGPDGKAQTVPLEATGAGAYGTRLGLSRPGAYVATAVDEQSNEVVGTTGAVLSAGEELRATGSDRAMLRRIASLTGGTLRDTLAGIFHDRARARFAYQDLERPLLMLGALALLFGVGARRLALPPSVGRALGRGLAMRQRLRSSRRTASSSTERVPQDEAAGAQNAGAKLPSTTLESLLLTKSRTAGRGEPDVLAPVIPPGAQVAPGAQLGSNPRAAPGGRVAGVSAQPESKPRPTPERLMPPQRSLSAAEILLARRNKRRG